MSSVYDDPSLFDGVIEQCVELLEVERITSMQDRRLVGLDDEALVRGGGSLPGRLATALQEKSRGKFTVLTVDQAVVPNPLVRSVYFVRAVDNNQPYEEPVTEIADGMVLCEINPYRSSLFVGIAYNNPLQVRLVEMGRAAAREAEAIRAAKAAERRSATEEEYAHVVSRIELALERVLSDEANRKWAMMRSPHTQYRGRILLEDLIELCSMLGMPVQNLFEHPPT